LAFGGTEIGGSVSRAGLAESLLMSGSVYQLLGKAATGTLPTLEADCVLNLFALNWLKVC